MKTIVLCFIVFFLFLTQDTEAASIPASPAIFKPALDPTAKTSYALAPTFYHVHKEPGFLKRLQLFVSQKRGKYRSRRRDGGTASKFNVLSIASVVAGIIAVVGLAAGSFLVAVIAAPVALITGMIALGKSHMASRESRAAAIIGVVLGGVVIAVIAFYALLFSSLSNSFD